MSEADLESSGVGLPRSALARGAIFLALGAAVHIALALGSAPQPGPVIVLDAGEVRALERAFFERNGFAPDAAIRSRLIDREIDDRLLVAEARRRGWHRNDPVIRRRLIQNQRFLGADADASDEALLDLAYEQGMDRTDVVVTRRLMERVRLAVAEAARREPIPEAELEAYRRAHLELFRQPARVSLSQVFLSRDRRGEALASDAQALAERLAREAPTREEALAWADPSLLPRSLDAASEDELARHFGPDFAREAHAAPIGAWTGPIASPFGLHFVRVDARSDAVDPPLPRIEDHVRARVQREREDEALRRLLVELRREASIDVRADERREAGTDM